MKETQEKSGMRMDEVSRRRCPAEIRIGTRASRLAVAQATEVKNRLLGAFPELTQEQIHIVKMITTGDQIQDRHLADIGGKGLFTKEIEEALHAGTIDLAVHSMKDMPDTLPKGLLIPCTLEREDPRDAYLSRTKTPLATLPKGAVVGTSSLRRQSQLLHHRPDLTVVPFRGNVVTRKQKLDQGDVDACLLAVAGLNRIDASEWITHPMEPEFMLPAVAQGAIAVEIAERSLHIVDVLDTINHADTFTCITLERAFLKTLGGSCKTPIAGYAHFTSAQQIHFRGLIAYPDGSKLLRVERFCSPSEVIEAGVSAGEELLRDGKAILAACA